MKRVVRLSVIRNERKHADGKHLRSHLYKEIGASVSRMGDDISGFAFVGWAKNGVIYTTVCSGAPFGRSIPEVARDALNQHIAGDLIETPPAPKK